jgi:hypothetical protein
MTCMSTLQGDDEFVIRHQHQQQQEGPKWECIYCHSVMDRTNFTDFIKQSDNDKNSAQEARVQYHTWRAVQQDDDNVNVL